MADTTDTGAQKAESVITKAETFVTHVVGKVKALFAKDQKLAPEAIQAVTDTYEKVETFLAITAGLVSEDGLNLPADSAAFAAFKSMLSQFQSDAGVLKSLV